MSNNIEEVYQAALEAWPGVLVAFAAFEARLRQSVERRNERLAVGRAKSKSAEPAAIVTSDLYLAVALERGDHAAWERFYRDDFEFVRNVAGKFAASAEDAEELAQQFCSTIQERIRGYAGWCSLRGWLCAVLRSEEHTSELQSLS
jgi:hypothetical protein